jgi:hypothetical protein
VSNHTTWTLTEVYILYFLDCLSRPGSRDLGGTSDGAEKDIIVQSYQTQRALSATEGSIFRKIEGRIRRKLDHTSRRLVLSEVAVAARYGETRATATISLVGRVGVSEDQRIVVSRQSQSSMWMIFEKDLNLHPEGKLSGRFS